MSKNELYKISRKGESYTVKANVKGENLILLKQKLCDLKQYGLALVTTDYDGSHSIYLPTCEYGYPHNVVNILIPVTLAISNITDYEYVNDVFILHKDNYFVFLWPYSYSLYISSVGIADGRGYNMKKLYAKELHVKKDLSSYEKIVCIADGVDYAITKKACYTSSIASQYSINRIREND